MLLNKYYVVYACVPSGYMGVEMFYAENREKLEQAVRNNRNYAVIYILEGR